MSSLLIDECVSAQTIDLIRSLGFAETHLEQTLFVVDHNKYRKRRA